MSKSPIGWKATSKEGVIAAGGAGAVAAGMKILEADGNAADAAVATLLALMVTDHGECSIGGEVPLIIYDAENEKSKHFLAREVPPFPRMPSTGIWRMVSLKKEISKLRRCLR